MAALYDAKHHANCTDLTPSFFWIVKANRASGSDEAVGDFRLAEPFERVSPQLWPWVGGDEVIAPVQHFKEAYTEAKAAGFPQKGISQIRVAMETVVRRIGQNRVECRVPTWWLCYNKKCSQTS
ncbi:hypothetical protein GGR57DRAFT_395026 [Xylariaceae sp. FL1272]|nr:hypothetical protein GGR57DRAFT_395026 [Xylariaceae sp. FL1272]